jgi:hypothetical protein
VELEWGPVVQDVCSRSVIAVAFLGLKPGMGVRLQLSRRLEPGRALGRSRREVVTPSGSVTISLDVPRDRLGDGHFRLSLVEADLPSHGLWAGEYPAAETLALPGASEAAAPASPAPAEPTGRLVGCQTQTLYPACATCAELKMGKSG